jgi:hypothetical protein
VYNSVELSFIFFFHLVGANFVKAAVFFFFEENASCNEGLMVLQANKYGHLSHLFIIENYYTSECGQIRARNVRLIPARHVPKPEKRIS